VTARLLFHETAIAPSAMEEAVRRAASGLEHLGVRPGDVVCVMLHNQPAFIEAMLAARLLGAYYCPINWHYKAEEAGWMLRDSGAKVLVTDGMLRAQIEAGISSELQVIADWSSWRNTFAEWSGASRPPGAFMPYTSGTTGRAKGVRRLPQTPEQIARFQQGLAHVLGIEPGMRALLPAPLYHSGPSSYGLQSTLQGELLVLEERFDAERALALIEQHRLTHAYLVPTMYVRMLRLPEAAKRKYDVSSIRFVASTGSPCPAEVKRAMINWWGPAFYESYAASELGYVTCIPPRKRCASQARPANPSARRWSGFSTARAMSCLAARSA
jgi:long-chain acyl-CoA synthetase